MTFATISGQPPSRISGPAEHELQPVCQVIQVRMLGCNFQRLWIDIQANCPRHAYPQCRQREHARSGTNVEDAFGNRDGARLFDGLDAQCRRWMMACSKGRGISQSKRAVWSGNFGRHDQNTPDTNGTRT
jgi:hypothetical protein